MAATFLIRPATVGDVPVIRQLIRELAEYEREPTAARATEEGLREVLFGEKPSAQVLLALENDEARSASRCTSLISPPGWPGPGFIWKIFFVRPALQTGKLRAAGDCYPLTTIRLSVRSAFC